MKNPNDAVDLSTMYTTFVRLKRKVKQVEVKPKPKKRK